MPWFEIQVKNPSDHVQRFADSGRTRRLVANSNDVTVTMRQMADGGVRVLFFISRADADLSARTARYLSRIFGIDPEGMALSA